MTGARRRLAWSILLTLLWALLTVGAVAAHAELRQARPGPGDVLKSAPSEITLDFSEALTSGEITLFGAGFTPVAVTSRQKDDDTLVATLPALEDGRYTVQWDVVSADGDPIGGSYDFVVDGASGGVPAGWRWLGAGAVALLLWLGRWVARRRRAE